MLPAELKIREGDLVEFFVDNHDESAAVLMVPQLHMVIRTKGLFEAAGLARIFDHLALVQAHRATERMEVEEN